MIKMARKGQYNIPKSQRMPTTSKNRFSGSEVPAAIMWPRIVIMLTTLALVLLGFVMVYSSSSIVALNEGVSTESYLIKQIMFAVVGVIACIIVWKFIPYYLWLGPFVWVAWGLSMVLLVMTAVMGSVGYGAQRWVDLGVTGIQPSEFAKIAFLLMSARILLKYREGDMTFRDMLVQAFILVLVPLLFMYRSQSDLGTTLICFVGILMVMWLGEVPLKVIVGIIVLGLLFAVAASSFGYRQDRFVFLDPWSDGEGGLGSGYQLVHSYYAFAEGGLFGVGLGNSREKFLYLPMSETDFIFAIIGEELGLLGAMAVIILFLVFLWAGLRIARSAPDTFGSLLAGGFTAMIVFQAFLNIGCVIGVLPTTGKPLPFISAGGSSLVASLIMFGIIMSVSNASTAPSVYEQRRADLRIVKAQSNARVSGSRPPSESGQKSKRGSRSMSNTARPDRTQRSGRGSRR